MWFSSGIIWRSRGPCWEDEVFVNMFRMFPRRWAHMNLYKFKKHVCANMFRDVMCLNESTHNKAVHILMCSLLHGLYVKAECQRTFQIIGTPKFLKFSVSLLFHLSLILYSLHLLLLSGVPYTLFSMIHSFSFWPSVDQGSDCQQ